MLKQIQSNIRIKATDGKELIHHNPIFSWTDPDFNDYGIDKESHKTEDAIFEMRELVESGTFKEIYESLGVPLDNLCVTQSQILEFIKSNEIEKSVWGYYFLMKKDSEFFVAHVYRGDGELRAGVGRFDVSFVWYADLRYRFAFPQLENQALNPSPSESLTLEKAIALCKENGLEVYKKM